MQTITIPAADVVWKVPGEPPKDEAAWLAVENAAIAMAESGNLLMMEGRARDQGQWMQESAALIDVAVAAATAAREKNVEKFTELGDTLYSVCESCHKHYMPQPPQGHD